MIWVPILVPCFWYLSTYRTKRTTNRDETENEKIEVMLRLGWYLNN